MQNCNYIYSVNYNTITYYRFRSALSWQLGPRTGYQRRINDNSLIEIAYINLINQELVIYISLGN